MNIWYSGTPVDLDAAYDIIEFQAGYYGHVRMSSDRTKLVKAIKNLLTKANVRYETRTILQGVNEVIVFTLLGNFKISQLENSISKEKLLRINKTRASTRSFLAEFG